ncbi:MAG: TIGR04283 family arsenosugar biosynthesis glycosyltransferase, partial [Gammaproteobacteria bacterium]|nr:TIGR04283 family arsenosugar biosynthesis glycosyltransferase [Gammaproteobacteria bacterium]
FSQAGEFEVIVVDGGSTDNTLAIVSQDSRIQLFTAATGRASQMNAGAQHASGDWLLFLHADTLLPRNALLSIEQLSPEHQAGGFKHRFSGHAWNLRLISWMHNFRCRWTRIFYGDQAMFVRRELFTELGMFPNEPMLEDLLFSEQLVKVTRPVILDSYVITESRKFEQNGVWLSFWRVLLILASHELHLPIPAKKFFANVR